MLVFPLREPDRYPGAVVALRTHRLNSQAKEEGDGAKVDKEERRLAKGQWEKKDKKGRSYRTLCDKTRLQSIEESEEKDLNFAVYAEYRGTHKEKSEVLKG